MPAVLCSITGLKTSFGLIPEAGVFPLAPSYNSVGLIVSSADDCARLFGVLTGAHLALMLVPYGWRLRVFNSSAYPVPVEPAIQYTLDAAVDVFVCLGALPGWSVPPLSLAGLTRDAGALIGAEARNLHRARFETAPSAFGAEL